MKTVAIAVVAGALLVLGGIALRHSSRRFSTSGLAPDFSLTDLSGRALRLSDHRGKVIVLDFWATWCEPCKEEIPHFVEMQNRYAAQGLQVIGISMDDEDKPVRDFQQKYKMNYPVARGTPELAGQYGGILGLPITFVIDRTGHIAARHIGAVNVSAIDAEVQKLLAQPM
jgi:cytochrome c biogenesis protein CcmG/thiol:disulfide interchange protein DsbE